MTRNTILLMKDVVHFQNYYSSKKNFFNVAEERRGEKGKKFVRLFWALIPTLP